MLAPQAGVRGQPGTWHLAPGTWPGAAVGLYSLAALMPRCGQEYQRSCRAHAGPPWLCVLQLRSPAGALTAHKHWYFCRSERGWWH